MIRKLLQDQNLLCQSSILIVFFIVSLLCSCSSETSIANGNNRLLEFSVSVPSWKEDVCSSKIESRATPITDSSLGTDKSFKLIADQKEGTGSYSTLIDNEAVTCSNNLWKTTKDYYWSDTGSKTINFYACYPASIPNGTITHIAGSAPTLPYTVPDDAASQTDILMASSPDVSGSTCTSIPLTFKHIFAAVQFSVGNSGLPSGTISSITISGIKNSGTYTFGSGWILNSGTTTFNASPSTAINGTSGESITSGTYTFLMIPQAFSNAVITLTYNTGTAYTRTISGTWSAENTYTYNLSKPVNIGDYYYSDGTWGSIAEHTNSTASPIGVIFSNSTSNIDKEHNWTHGYAMALQNAGSATATYQWSSNSDNPTGTFVIGASEIMSDQDGYTHTNYLQTTSYAAGIAAKGYMAKDKDGNTITTPSNTSDWYLPSSGQWYDICANLGKMVAVSGKAYTESTTYWIRWYNGDISGDTNSYSSICISNLNTYLNAIMEKGYDVNLFDINEEYYWTSSECDVSSACHAPFRIIGVAVGTWPKTELCRVRSVIAF